MIGSDDPAAIGLPSTILLRNVIAAVLDVVIASWANLKAAAEVNQESTEPYIAGCLGRAMKLEKDRRGLKFFRVEEEVGTRSFFNFPKPDGRIDIKIIYSFDEGEYFGIECKRVSGKNSKLARDYVKEGVLRFVSEKYSPGHDWAAMLGFVIDGDSAKAIKRIQAQLQKMRQDVNLSGEWTLDKEFTLKRNLYRTGHEQRHSRFQLTILHLFLSLN